MNRFRQEAFRCVWITLLSGVLCYVGYFVLDLSILGGTLSKRDSESDVVNFFYSIENRGGTMPADTSVVLFDLAGLETPAEIAGAVARLGACSPGIVGLDIIFRKTPAIAPAEYDSLEAVLAGIPNLVTACRIVPSEGGYRVEHSFYTASLGLPYGAANSPLNGYRPCFVVAGDTIPSLASLLARRDALPGKGRFINYTNRYFPVIPATAPFDEADFRGKTVIVGDVGDLRDFHDLPFRLNGSKRVPGAMLLAYAASTINQNRWVGKLADGWCIGIALVLSYFFALFYRRKAGKRYGSLVIRGVQVLLVLGLWFAGYLVFTAAGYVINLVYTMLGVLMVGLSDDLVGWAGDRLARKRQND